MKKCRRCHYSNHEEAKFCSKCGRSFTINNDKNLRTVLYKGKTHQIAFSHRRLINGSLDFLLGWVVANFVYLHSNNIIVLRKLNDFQLYLPLIAASTAYFLYFFLCEVGSGRTVGKFVSRTIVVAEDGTEPTAKAIAIRSLARFIPFEFLSFYGDQPISWHDRLSKTVVIEDKPQS